MPRPLISLCLLFCCLASLGQRRDTTLLNAYKSNSLSRLQNFFENWANETQRREELSTSNDTTKNIYSVFEAFYNPKDVNRTGGSEWGNDIYKDAKYLLVQDRIAYAIVDAFVKNDSDGGADNKAFKRPEKYDILFNFRPTLSFSDARSVVLTKTYDSLLNRFLGNKHYKLGAGSIMSPARSKGESDKRKQFLEHFIKIWYGHWGGYWQLYSYPYASRITFDKDFQNAIVDYEMIYEGGYAYLKKIDGRWTLVKAKRTWIE